MKLYSRNEIVNKHGQPIYYWSKQKGNTELEKYKNFIGFTNNKFNEFIIKDKNNLDMTCIVNTNQGPEGYYLVCFNHLGETIFQTEDCYNPDKTSIIDCLFDNNIL
jgi:hypothetical protein